MPTAWTDGCLAGVRKFLQRGNAVSDAKQASSRRQRGAAYERHALAHLEAAGLSLVARNFRCRLGEIDLIMRDRHCLVIVEVRYRSPSPFTSAALSVDRHKQRKLANTAAWYLGRRPRFANAPVRFDVVAFDRAPDGQCKLQWIRDAFRP